MPYKHHNTIRLGRSRYFDLFDTKKMYTAICIGVAAGIGLLVCAIGKSK